MRERSTGVAFAGTLATAYRVCVWSRIANRVFLELARLEAGDAEAFYAAVREIDWSAHLGPTATLACDFSGRHPSITHTHFGALRLKDAIVDTMRAATGSRPDVELNRPSVRVHAHAHGTNITVSLDLSGVNTDISVENSEGEIAAETVQGEVLITGGAKIVKANSVEGEVRVARASGKIEANSVNAGVRLSECSGQILASSINGEVRMTDIASDDVEASTINGVVSYEGQIKDGGSYRFRMRRATV